MYMENRLGWLRFLSTDVRNYTDDALIPVKKAFFASCFKMCLAQLKQLYIAHVLKHLVGIILL